MTHFLLFLEQVQIKYPLDDKVTDNLDFEHQWKQKPFRAEINAHFTPAADMMGPSGLVSEPLPG